MLGSWRRVFLQQRPTRRKGLGLEFDGQIAYQAKKRGVDGGIRLELNGGVLIPLGGFDMSTVSETYETSVAWTLEAQIGLLF